MTEYCEQLMYAGTLETPPEFCDNEPEPGTERCAYHTAPDLWDRADEEWSRIKEDSF